MGATFQHRYKDYNKMTQSQQSPNPDPPTPPKESISTLYTAEEIYKHRDIRTQTIQEAEVDIQRKRVSRLILVQKHQQKVADKADKIISTKLKQFQRKTELFNNNIAAINERIQKAEKYLLDLQQLDQTLTVEEDKLL